MSRVVALVPDLMDRSKLTAALGADVELVATPRHLSQRLTGEGPDPAIVVVDLGRRGAIEALPPIQPATAGRFIGFGPHVERDVLRVAREAGCDEVLARSVFFPTLDRLQAP